MRIFSHKDRPAFLGPYPLERLPRSNALPDYQPRQALSSVTFKDSARPYAISNAMTAYMDLFNTLRDGDVAPQKAPIPDDPGLRAQNLKGSCYFVDASMVGIGEIPETARLADGDACQDHGYAVAILIEYTQDPKPGEPGEEWIAGTQAARAAVRSAEVAALLAGYIRRLGFAARAHTATATDLDFELILLATGLGEVQSTDGQTTVINPYLGDRFGMAVVSTTMELATDKPLALRDGQTTWQTHGPAWWLGIGGATPGWKLLAGKNRPLHMGSYPMEKIKRVQETTTVIDGPNVPRVPKRAEFFVRAAMGDLGERPQQEMVHARFAAKHPFANAMQPLMGGMIPMQFGQAADTKAEGTDDSQKNADAIKALCYYMGGDMVGICEAVEYAWYSHKHDGEPIEPYHKYAIPILVDQGYETMEGASGDDWISGAQSFRAYTRSSLIAGVVAEHIRRLGYAARTHTVVEQDVLHIPLILLAGLGELSRIGELVLNPFVGPRFKSVVITTDMPLAVDQPIDFGLQDFCNKCLKCARECPVQAISYSDKIMFNGYEMWKPDVQKCATYRVTNGAGSACGRCMKTCPYNIEGILAERAFLWAAIKLPFTREWIAKLDDKVGNGRINPIKKWWFDIETVDGKIVEAARTNRRELHLDRSMNAEQQKIAVFPADMNPPPGQHEPFPVDREEGRRRTEQAEKPEEYRSKRGVAATT